MPKRRATKRCATKRCAIRRDRKQPEARADAPRSAPAPGQTRTYDPNTARRDDRERTTTYSA